MSFWIGAIALSALSLVLLARPLWRKVESEIDRADYDLSVFKDQLKELDKDLERGLISAEEAETARVEIQRRLLAADDKRKKDQAAANGPSMASMMASGVVAIAVIAGSVSLYMKLGMPGYEDVPFASRDIQQERQHAQSKGMDKEIAALQKRLQEEPKDVEAWLLLARTMRITGKLEESVKAYKGAVDASERNPNVLVDYAEAKIYAAEGGVDKEAFETLKEAVANDPAQLKGRFYLGYAQLRREDFSNAIQTWTDLKVMSPPDADWLQQVDQQIQMAAQAGELDASTFTPSAQAKVFAKQFALEWENEASHDHEHDENGNPVQEPGPSRADMEAAQEMSPEEQAEMIRGMVDNLAERLKENPDDLEGWERLARAYMVLGEKDKAIEARNMIKQLSGG